MEEVTPLEQAPALQDEKETSATPSRWQAFRSKKRNVVFTALGVMGVTGVALFGAGVFSNDQGSREYWATSSLLPASVNFEAYDRLYPPFYEQSNLATQPKFFAKFVDGSFYFSLVPPTGSKLRDSVVFFNLDLDRSTGYSTTEYFVPNGTEAYLQVNFNPDGTLSGPNPPAIFSGCPPEAQETDPNCRQLIETVGGSDVSYISSTGGVEIRIAKSTMEGLYTPVEDIGITLRLKYGTNDQVTAPEFFQEFFILYEGINSLPACTNEEEIRAAVVFSQDVSDNFFDDRSYSTLFMSMQSQLFQAGIPHDRLDYNDLLDISKICRYDVLVIPYLAYIDETTMFKLRKSIFFAVHYYGVGIIASGDFAANRASDRKSVDGDPYFLQQHLFGIADEFPVALNVTKGEVTVFDNSISVFADQALGQVIVDETVFGKFANQYVPGPNTAFDVNVIARQTLELESGEVLQYNAILTSELPQSANPFNTKSGRIFHIGTLAVLGNVDIVWRAAQWVVQGTSEVDKSFGLVMSRQSVLFFMRSDCDQSMFKTQAATLMPAYGDILEEWYNLYNFVGANYINVGNDKDADEETIWSFSGPEYQRWMDMEHEIGSHSFTHPHNISALSEAELEFEFEASMRYIKGNLSLTEIASAQPGQSEDLRTFFIVSQWVEDTYWSSGYSGVNAGYPNAFGFATVTGREPGIGSESNPGPVFMAPNMYFDFSLNQFLNMTSAEALEFWLDQWEGYTQGLGNLPMIHWPIHDYAPTDWNDVTFELETKEVYNKSQFDVLIARAFEEDSEFITPMQFSKRVRTFDQSSLLVSQLGANQYYVVVPPVSGRSLGTFAVQLHDFDQVIRSVDGWYAYSSQKVFLPQNGGTFTIRTDYSVIEPVTRIVKMDMRMQLVSATGDGESLSFVVEGRGNVTVEIAANSAVTSTMGGSSVQQIGNTVVFRFATVAQHTASVTVVPTAQPTKSPTKSPTKQPTKTPTVRPTQNPTQNPTKSPTSSPTIAPTRQPTSSPTFTLSPSVAPTMKPTSAPSMAPTMTPTGGPTNSPSKTPTQTPTTSPSTSPSSQATTTSPSTSPGSQATTTSPSASPGSQGTGNAQSPTPSPNQPGVDPRGQNQEDDSSSGPLIGGIVGGVAAVALAGAGAAYFIKKRNSGIDAGTPGTGAPPSVDALL